MAGAAFYDHNRAMPNPVAMDVSTAMTLRDQLKLSAFFPDITPEKVKQLFPNGGLYYFSEGEALIRQGTVSRNLYILQTGQVRVTRKKDDGTRVELAVLPAPQLLGEIALLKPDAVRTADVDAVVPSRVFRLTADDVGRLNQATPELGKHLIELAKARLAGQ